MARTSEKRQSEYGKDRLFPLCFHLKKRGIRSVYGVEECERISILFFYYLTSR